MPDRDRSLDVLEKRAVHRIVRAMHDGECPQCHRLFVSNAMIEAAMLAGIEGHACPSCGFQITADESAAALQEFAEFMESNLAIFESWRKARA